MEVKAIKVWNVITEIDTQMGERIYSSDDFYTKIGAQKFYNSLTPEAKFYSTITVSVREIVDHEVVWENLSELINKEIQSCL